MTRTGRALAAAGFVLISLGVLAGYPEVIGLGAACLAAIGVAALFLLSRPTVTASREMDPTRVTEGAPASASLTVSNAGHRRSLPLVIREQSPAGAIDLAVPSLGPGEAFDTSYRLNALARGVYRIGPSPIRRCDPLRLLSVAQGTLEATTVQVHPRYCFLDLASLGRAPGSDQKTMATSPAGGVEFHSIRKYERGIDLRLVHWKASARAGTLMIRNNVMSLDPRLMVVLDTSQVYKGEGFDEAVRIAASFCVSARVGDIPVSLRTTGGDAPVGAAPGSGASAFLDCLAAARTSRDDRGLIAIPNLYSGQPGATLVVVTGEPAPRSLSRLSIARRHYRPVIVVQVGGLSAANSPIDGLSLLSVGSLEDFESAWNGS